MNEALGGSATSSWIFFALLSAIFAALTNIFAKIGVADIPSNMATWVRVIVIIVVATPIIYFTGDWRDTLKLPNKTILFLVLSGIATGASWLAYFKALQLGQAAQVAPVDKLSVVLVMIIGVTCLGEKLDWKGWCGGVLILAGVLLIAWPNSKPVAQQAPVETVRANQ